MDVANVVRDLLRQPRLLVLAVALALLAALATQYKLSLLPPKATGKSLEYGAAQTQILVDAPKTPVVNLNRDFYPLASRAAIFTQLMTSAPVKAEIGRDAGIPGSAIVASAPVATDQPKASKEPGAEQRSSQILGEVVPHRLHFAAQPDQPIITISSQAPTGEEAVRLADASVTGFRRYLAEIQATQDVRPSQRVKVEQLGPAVGGPVNQGTNRMTAVFAFGVVLIGGCVAILFIGNLRRGWRDGSEAAAEPWVLDEPIDGRFPGGSSEPEQGATVDPVWLPGRRP